MIYNGFDDFKMEVAMDKHEIFLNIKNSLVEMEEEKKNVNLNIKF